MNKIQLIILVILLTGVNLCSTIARSQPDSVRYSTLMSKADSVYNLDLNLAIKWLKESIEISQENKWELKEGIAQRELAKAYITSGNIEATDYHINRAIDIFKRHKALNRLANAYSLKSILRGRINDHKEAVLLLQKAIEIQLEANNEEGLATMYANISIHFTDMKQYHKAEEYLLKSEELNIKLGDERSLFYTYINMGNIYILKGEFEKAKAKLSQSLMIGKKYKNTDGVVTCLNFHARLYAKMGLDQKALAYFEEGLEMARSNNLPMEESELLADLKELYVKKGAYKKAYNASETYYSLKDSMYSIDKLNKISELEKKLELQEKESIIKGQTAEISKANLEVEYQKNIKFIVLLAAVILLVFIGFIIKNLIAKRKANDALEVKQQEISEINDALNQQNEEILAQRDKIETQREALEIKNHDVHESIMAAERIQIAFFQSEEREKVLLPSHFAFFKPRDVVSGDFYWSHISKDFYYISVVDCTGHGVPGAVMSMLALSLIREVMTHGEEPTPAAILNQLRSNLISELGHGNEGTEHSIREGMDMSLIRIKKDGSETMYAGANNPIYVCNPDNLTIYKADKQSVSYHRKLQPYIDQTVATQSGDMIYLFSDGFPDQFGGKRNKKFGYKQFRDLLQTHCDKSPDEQKDVLEHVFNDWIEVGSDEQIDDVCLLGVRVV